MLIICGTAWIFSTCGDLKKSNTDTETAINATKVDTQQKTSQNKTAATETPSESETGYEGDIQSIFSSIVQQKQSDINNNSIEVENAYVTESGHLYIVLNNHNVIDVGQVRDSSPMDNVTDKQYTVHFYDYDGSPICSREVSEGEMAIAPDNPIRDGYVFIGWDKPFSAVYSDLDVTAQYQPLASLPQITLKDAAVFTGINSVDVEIDIQNHPGILGATLQLDYDGSVLSLVSAESGSSLDSLTFTKPGRFESPCKFTWDGIELNDSDICDGTMLKMTFVIADGVSAGVYPITLSYDENDIINADLEPVEININSGSIIIIS